MHSSSYRKGVKKKKKKQHDCTTIDLRAVEVQTVWSCAVVRSAFSETAEDSLVVAAVYIPLWATLTATLW